MGAQSGIEWTDATWTPIRARHRATGKVGWHCEHASEGCRNCYAEGMNKRLGTGLPPPAGRLGEAGLRSRRRAAKPGHRDDIEIFLDDKTLLVEVFAFLRWKLDEGALTLGIQLHRVEHVRQAVFKQIVEYVADRTSCPVVFGKSEN